MRSLRLRWHEWLLRHEILPILQDSRTPCSASTQQGELMLLMDGDAHIHHVRRGDVVLLPRAPKQTWLAGALDPQIGVALSAIHRDPGHDWTVEELARACSLSRSAFAARFVARVQPGQRVHEHARTGPNPQ